MEHVHEVIVCEWKEIVQRAIFALTILMISTIYPILNKASASGENIIKTFIDDFIPFNKYFIVPYMLWYGYVAFFIALLCIYSEENYYKLILSINLGMMISYLIYYTFPTTVVRPTIVGNDIFSNMILSLYQRDNPFNCFPSIHVLNSLLVAIYVNEEKKIDKGFKIICSVFCILIMLSTMFIKQHFFLDVISATLIAYVLYINLDIIWSRFLKNCLE